MLLEHANIDLPTGVAFVPMRTSDLGGKGRAARQAADLHERIASVSAVVPTTIKFSFDAELRTTDEMERIAKQLKDRAEFLPRRMYENYLLDPRAIANIVSRYAAARVNESDVCAWLVENKYAEPSDQTVRILDEETVDAAK